LIANDSIIVVNYFDARKCSDLDGKTNAIFR